MEAGCIGVIGVLCRMKWLYVPVSLGYDEDRTDCTVLHESDFDFSLHSSRIDFLGRLGSRSIDAYTILLLNRLSRFSFDAFQYDIYNYR